jgi:hypothetical protein
MDEVEVFGPSRMRPFASYSISTMDVFFTNLLQDESINRFRENWNHIGGAILSLLWAFWISTTPSNHLFHDYHQSRMFNWSQFDLITIFAQNKSYKFLFFLSCILPIYA